MADLPEQITAMPIPPNPTEVRTSFVEKAIAVWDWLLNNHSRFNDVVLFVNETKNEVQTIATGIDDSKDEIRAFKDTTEELRDDTQNIVDNFHALLVEGAIRDDTIVLEDTWSSDKIYKEARRVWTAIENDILVVADDTNEVFINPTVFSELIIGNNATAKFI